MATPEVYVIDDDPYVAEVLCHMAEVEGFKTSFYTDANSFFNVVPNKSDIIILDLVMPDVDGVEVIRRLSDSNFSSSLLLVSGHDRSVLHAAEKLAKAQKLNVLGSLTKPIVKKQLLELINSSKPSIKGGENGGEYTKDSFSLAALKYAIEKNQIVTEYQPQYSIAENTVSGIEALARWHHPDLGTLYPNRFIKRIEHSSLISQFTLNILMQAVQQSALLRNREYSIPIAVNVSAKNILDLTLPEQLLRLVEKNSLQASSIKLEITETALMEELVTSLDILTRMRMKGFDLSIDDFGTGYSSLSLLHRVPFTEMKIDKSFVMAMEKDPEAYSIVETCVMLGKKLNMTVVAEGVETRKAYDILADFGCDIVQGTYIAAPMSRSEIVSWLIARDYKKALA